MYPFTLFASKLTWQTKTIDFGEISVLDSTTRQIIVYNTTDTVVVIDSVYYKSPSIAVTVNKKELAPDDSGVLSISLRENHGDYLDEYPFIVYSNIGYDVIRVSGGINTGIAFEEPEYEEIRLLRQDTTNLLVNLTVTRDENPTFTLAKKHKNVVGLDVERIDSTYVLNLKLYTEELKKTFSEVVSISTGIKEWSTITLPISGDIIPLIELSKHEVDFGKISRRLKHRDRVEVHFNKGTEFTVTKQETLPNHVLVNTVKPQGRKWTMHFTVYPHSPLGKFHGYTLLYLNNSPKPQIAVSIVGEVVE